MRNVLIVSLTAILFHAALNAQTITAVYAPAAVAGGGGSGTTGSPYAVYVRIEGWAACAGNQAYLKIYSGTNNEYMWSSTGAWMNSTTYNAANQPIVDIDGAGGWSGWIYAKHNDGLGLSGKVRAARVGATSTNLTTAVSLTFSVLTTSVSGNGGWIVRPISPAIDKGILAYSGGAVVGSYRTEENGVAEGYVLGSGGFKIAVPVGYVDSLVLVGDNGVRDTAFVGPWTVTAGQETDASLGTGQAGKGTAAISPASLQGGQTHALTLTILGEAGTTITHAWCTVPSGWTWSHGPGDVTAAGSGLPVVAVSGDTMYVTDAAVAAGDSLLVQIKSVTPPDTTALFRFPTGTGASGESAFPLSVQPSVFVYSTPLPIRAVKENDPSGMPVLNNQTVTVRGIVTVASQFGSPSSIQDNTGGLAVYGWDFSHAVAVGDEVIVSGLVQPFKGLTEIVNPLLHGIMSRGNAVFPLVVSAAQLAADGAGGVEAYEGLLVRLNGVTAAGSGAWQANTNYALNDATGSTQIRIDDSTGIAGAPIPASAFDVIGVVGQFVNAAPYIGGYQLMPRSKDDVISSGPLFATVPVESGILPDRLTVGWTTINAGSSGLRYGKTAALELGVVVKDSLQTRHELMVTGLQPATIYYLGAFSAAAGDTSFASPLIASTASPASSTGAMHVYFNKSVDTGVSWDTPAAGGENLASRLIVRLNNARRSIDVAVYSLSGTPGPGSDVAAALLAARSRGVSVRVICEDDNSSTSPFNTLRNGGIPVVTDRLDAVNGGAGLMHNKFFVVDGRGGTPDSVWVWTGSWNVTQSGTYDDYQNAVEIQDPALAGAYTAEFNEMWGGTGDQPGAGLSRFGARKTDNTPHRFVIAGKNIECYFSPSDRTSACILNVLGTARHSISFAMLTLTRADIASAMIAAKNAGRKVRGVTDNGTDSGSQYGTLTSAGIDVRLKTGTGLLHHKYGIVDGEDPSWSPSVITGSHNWTGSAENSNNENTLVIHDGAVANQYLQEFTARYYQFGGADSVRVGVEEIAGPVPAAFALSQNYPNPFNPSTMIRFSLPVQSSVRLVVCNILGQEVATVIKGELKAGAHAVQFDGTGLASGMYFYRLTAGHFTETRKMLIMK